jgi:glycosyltransferase involved in cell wall biosynthesis
MTHIVFLHSSSEMYGSDRSLRSVVRAVVDEGHTATVILPNEGPLVAELEHAGARVRRLPVAVLRRSLLTPRGMATFANHVNATYRHYGWLRELASQERVVLVSNTSAVVSGFMLARHFKLDHTVIVREFFKPGLELKVFSSLIKQATKVVTVSQAVANQFEPSIRDRASVVYSGADLAHHEWSSQIESEPHEGLRLLCPGRLNAWKGQDVLVKALGLLGKDGSGVNTRIVGGEYGGTTTFTEGLVELVASTGAANVTLVGELPDITHEYLWCDVVVVPSKRAEPFGKVVIEAMNLARPVISTNIGGPAEVIHNGVSGILVDPDDPQALAEAIRSLVLNPSFVNELRGRAFERSLAFDASKSAQTITRIITS